MATSFLHGVETIVISDGVRSVTEVKTAVIGLVGIAPTGPQNICTLVRNDVDASKFGKQLQGFDIPQSLSHIFAQGAGTVIVVNVFDAVKHTINVVQEQQTIVDGKLKLSSSPIGDITMKNGDGSISDKIFGTDYTLDAFGNFLVINGRIADGTVLKFDYKKLNKNAVLDADIIGDVDNEGNRSGIKAFDLAFNLFGFKPKILIAPEWSSSKTITDALALSAERMRAVVPCDCLSSQTVTEVIASRGDATKSFGTSNQRIIPLYAFLQAYDVSKDDGNPESNTNSNFPYSAFFAGVMANTDKNMGYWFSPSNKEIKGATGLERPISANINDPESDTNLLNGAGITTVFNTYGTGFRSWGNRNASYPTNTQVDNFIALLRTFDVVHESLENAALQFNDLPVNQALVDAIRQSGNNFIKVLIGRGALTEGSKVVYDKGDNTAVTLSAGQLIFRIIKMGPTPAERISFYSTIDIDLLRASIK